MSYEEKWKILADLLAELQNRGETVPVDVFEDLKSAKTLIQVLKADPTHVETLSRIETYMRNVESFTIFTAEKYGQTTVDEWLNKLKDQQCTEKQQTQTSPRFVHGVPRDKNWVRIQILKDTPLEDLEKFAKECSLSYKTEEEGYVTVYGNKEELKLFVKTLAERFQGIRNG
ncbi:MAG: DUF2096 family protein [Candidatus Bathyarchaeia archaeon]|jgi:hypothetical protein